MAQYCLTSGTAFLSFPLHSNQALCLWSFGVLDLENEDKRIDSGQPRNVPRINGLKASGNEETAWCDALQRTDNVPALALATELWSFSPFFLLISTLYQCSMFFIFSDALSSFEPWEKRYPPGTGGSQ
jgi:hypothetical protein